VIDLNEFSENAEFLGKLGIQPCCAGKTSSWAGYQQSYPQYLGVSSLFYKNQGLSAGSSFKLCRKCASAQKRTAAKRARADRA
jgi:hypothetical protein